MNADVDLQVWLETFSNTQPAYIVPYVRSAEDKTLTYRLNTVKTSASGRSVMRQGGLVDVQAGVPMALVRMAISREQGDNCHIDVVLSEAGANEKEFHFQCPTPTTQ